ncbi:complex subunit 7-like protein [Lamellibrachia satsuma]|nr:complex subunit 7-like protein [Lamellibrachia satsuma]
MLSTMAVSDDEIIKRKLLIEGDGGNDDRRVSSLLKTFLKWCDSSETPDESNNSVQRMLATVAQCELAMEKSRHVYEMNQQEQAHYQELNQKIEHQIEEVLNAIIEAKNELRQAKRIRRNRQEYDALAKVIQQHPDRQETLKQLESLGKELESLQEQHSELQHKLELRRKQFHVLITATYEMQHILDEDEQSTDIEME